VSGAWAANVYTISGTPTSSGTFNYTVTTTNSNGCANVTASGTITVTLSVPPYSGSTWSCGSQIWSGALRNPAGCSQQTSLSTSSPPPAQYYDRGSTYGYYYNWTCVSSSTATLCPSPWRVPTKSDFDALVTCAGGNNSAGGQTMIGAWGTTGLVSGSDAVNISIGYIAGAPTQTSSEWITLGYSIHGVQTTQVAPFYGVQVRCVR
jgi:hypothetical protein